MLKTYIYVNIQKNMIIYYLNLLRFIQYINYIILYYILIYI